MFDLDVTGDVVLPVGLVVAKVTSKFFPLSVIKFSVPLKGPPIVELNLTGNATIALSCFKVTCLVVGVELV